MDRSDSSTPSDSTFDYGFVTGAVQGTGSFPYEHMYRRAVEAAAMAAGTYYHTDRVLIDDATYDLLARRIAATENAHPEWGVSTVTSTVAAGTRSNGDVAHETAMLSLDNALSKPELEGFWEKLTGQAGSNVEVCVEPKLDGLAVSVIYQDGQLTQMLTRGDGQVGEDVTGKAAHVKGLPETGPTWQGRFEVRGEVFMSDDDFAAANEQRATDGKPLFVNPRNGAAGALRSQTGPVLPLTFAAYSAPSLHHLRHDQAMAVLEEAGFGTARSLADGVDPVMEGFDAVWAAIELLGKNRDQLGYGIDGAVVKAVDPDVCRQAGQTSRAPRWAIAFKYAAETRTTRVKDITVQVGRTGILTPVAELEPVFVGGTTITRATLSNPEEAVRKDVRVGDLVWVRRAGDVIPEVVAVDVASRTENAVQWTPPGACPRCDSPVDRSQRRWRCTNRTCGLPETIRWFASRDCMDIEGLGDTLVRRLVTQGLVSGPEDLYRLTVTDLTKVERLGTVSARALIDQIAASKDRPVAAVITSLGMQTVGRRMGRVLARRFGSLDRFAAEATMDLLAELDTIGPVRAETIIRELDQVRDTVQALIRLGIGAEKADAATTGTADGVEGSAAGQEPVRQELFDEQFNGRVVVSGTVPGMTRQEAEMWVERFGGVPGGSVSKNTVLLVAGEGAGSKLSKAETLGVPVMAADTFAELCARYSST